MSAFTPIITKADLLSHFYTENLDEITRGNDNIVDTAISVGIAEVKIYLSRYDLAQLFGDETEGTDATFSDPYLTSLCKDVIAWHIIKLANPNISYEHITKCYDYAIDALKLIQIGKANPAWPYLDATDLTTVPGVSVSVFSNEKRENRY